MLQIAGLIVSILLLVVIQRLRALLARVFPSYSMRRLPAGTAAPPAYADLFESAHAELTALGFVGPDWFLVDSDPAEATTAKVHAAYRHPADGAVFWLQPSTNVRSANRLGAYVASRFADGRVALTQAYDPYFAATATADTPAQTVAPATLRMHYEAHRGWVAGFGAEPDRSFAEPAALLDVAAWHNRRREQLIACGRLRRDADGRVRARFGFALHLILAWQRCPKPPKDTQPVPAGRLATLAAAVENVRNAVPPARVQWALFGWSALLFAGVGAAAWHWRYAVLVLLVIGIHEFGHYAAMRAFGYRNVHMLALPLVGGVTIGQETRPSAARRAWMSLMGPLPGIAIGWLLLWLLPYTADARDWIRDAALLFLGINYLNVLPIPPLDGARVLQAMLPPRWHLVQAGFIVVTCVAGMVGAALIGMPAIAVIAGLQLMTISGTLQNGRTLRLLLAEGAPSAALPRPLRLRRVLDALQRVAGPARTALARIGQAEAVLHSADQPPMRWWQRGLLAGVLAALLVVPVGSALLYFVALRPQFDPQQLQARIDSGQAERREFERAAHALALSDLATALAGPGASAADADALRDAGQRIGQALPHELAALYRSANGVADEGVGAVEQIGRAERAEFERYAENDVLAVVDDKGQATSVAVERAAHWIRLGPADGDAQIYYDADPQPAVAGHRIIRIDDEGAAAVTDLRALLESVWITRQEIARANERRDARMRRARLALRDEPVPALLAEFPQPGLVERALLHSHGWPPSVDGKAIAAAEQRIGRALPEDLKTLYRQHDGVPPLNILQIEWLNRADAWPERFGALDVPPEDYAREFGTVDETASNPAATRIEAASLSHCVVVATSWHLRGGDQMRQRTPSTWWCPGENAQPDRWIAVRRATVYPSLHALLIDAAAVQRAARAID